MDVQISELLTKIKNEGVMKAETESKRLIDDAEQKAQAIIAEAETKAKALLEKADGDIKRQQNASRDALVQSGRDLLLSLEKKIAAMFEAALKESVDQALSAELIEKLALEMTKSMQDSALTVALNQNDVKKLGETLQAKLAKSATAGIEVVPSHKVSRGFRVKKSGSALEYDFTSEGIAEILGASVSPELSSILKEAAK